MELFLHPWYMVAGGVLVSSPIIIHLINRMRFKRIRWAAMEFLLKSQKRNRRRLIIEQLILLMLRILLVLLVAFLVARFMGTALGATSQGTMHVVILDDTLSMGDRWQDKGDTKTAFDVGKEQIRALAKNAGLANSAQHMKVYLLSDLNEPIYDNRLGDRTDDDLTKLFASLKPTPLHLDPGKAIARGREIFTAVPQGQKILHLVSDFRESDWDTGDKQKELNEEINKLLENGVNLSLLDAAHPFRNETRGVALNHDNLAIVDFKAESRMAAEGVPVEFTVTLANFGSKDEKTFLHVKVDGKDDFTASQPTDTLPAGQKNVEQKFTLLFAKQKSTPEFIHVSAALEKEETGLQADNVRDLVIEVRKKIPVLVVDGLGREGQKPGGDSFHIDVAFLSSRAYEAEFHSIDDLEKLNLDSYPSIYLLNVPMIRSEVALNKLRDYVKNGGSLAYFMGEKVVPSFYNEVLHKKYGGLFPVLLGPRQTDPLTPEERELRKQKDPQPKILFRDDKHPVVKEGLYPQRGAFRFLLIDRYFPTLPRSQWNPENEKEKVEEIITLPNRKSVDEGGYKQTAQELGKQAYERAKELSDNDQEFEKYLPVLEKGRRDITNALASGFLYNVVLVFDRLLEDEGELNNPRRPDMKALWKQPRMMALGRRMRDFRDNLLYGDPLVVGRSYGMGRVVVCLTTAGTATRPDKSPGWNEWGGGNPASWSYPVFIKDLERYLTSQSENLNRTVTDDANLKLDFDADKYREDVKIEFQPQIDLEAKKVEGQPDQLPPVEKFEGKMTEKDKIKTFTFRDARRPGVYTFLFQPVQDGLPPEARSFAFNVDATAESDLKRAAPEKLVGGDSAKKDSRAAKIVLVGPNDPEGMGRFKNRLPDASESSWLYLLFIVILLVEQALAVHLSFHLKPGDMPATTSTTRPQAAAA